MAQCPDQPRQLLLLVPANHGVYDGPDAASPHFGTPCRIAFVMGHACHLLVIQGSILLYLLGLALLV